MTYEFEKDIELRDYILEMATTGKSPKNWSQFVCKIEDLFKKSNKLECKHEILDQHFSDVFGHYFTCKNCRKEIKP